MDSGKFLVVLLSCWQIGASSAVQAAGENSVPLAQGTIEIVERKVPCSTAEFSYFFRVFVRGLNDRLPKTAIRNAYVWPQVEVRIDRKPSQLLVTAPKQDYIGDGFKIGLQQNLWVYLGPQVLNGNYPRLKVKFKPLTRQKIRVEYSQAEYAPVANARANQERLVKTFGESGAYIFEHRLGCWRLTQELRSAVTLP
ncbi:hypothetical protein [Chamaesiphon minutus]|uniref:Uncharacterized protein n=1 Tax=Chamaesiphon minutus (strain ATCC 27169 / PCC 6605) TaxID=1173020 RepID=K9UDQ5_CHAP6|nr:hypothetical protein [Chamaesiphon minutus]AFY92329.1 hypothetical protein Cha6605_1100 [Chamaesiphon minutus PCC 6605]